MRRIFGTFYLLLFFFGVFADAIEGSAKDSVVIDIDRGVVKPVQIALNFTYTPSLAHLQNLIETEFIVVIKNDLESTYLFKSISPNAFMQSLTSADQAPNFLLWRTINAQYLLNVEVKQDKDKVIILFRLYDVFAHSEVAGMSLASSLGELRKMAHITANKVYERVTGEQGYFDTKLLYVSTGKDKYGKKLHRLAIMDQDGYNHKFLSNGQNIVLTPRLAPNGKEFSYFSYKEKIVNGRRIALFAGIYRYNLASGKVELLARFPGMTYAPRYSPDGRLLIFSLSHHGSSSIYTYDLDHKTVTRITRGHSIDTSPCYSPDGKSIVFNSDRGGTQQLYIMDADGSNIRRLSFSKGRYATPVWSPRKDFIAFTKFGAGRQFYIGVIRPDGSGERMLAVGHLVEGPTWSPNGRVIMFSHLNRAGVEKIHSVDVTGYNQHEIKTPAGAIDPEWSAKVF